MTAEPIRAAARLDDRPRIAIFVDDFSATGVVTNALGLADELVGRGADVEFVVTREQGTLRSSVPSAIPVTQLLADDAPAGRRDRLRQSIRAYRRYLKQFAPGLLFSAGNHGHMTCVRAAAGLTGLRLMVRVSNELEQASPGARQSFLSRQRRRFKVWRITRAAHRMIFVSQQLLSSWSAAARQARAKAQVIPNGVDVAAVRRQANEPCAHPWLADGGEPVVLGVGRLVEQKNFGSLIEAAAIASAQRPVRLLLIGDGPLEASLCAQAAAAGLTDRFQIIAPVPNPMPFLAAAAVVALPSWWEGASNILLEALALRTPVVVSRTAGSAMEVLEDGTYGILVDPAEPGDIARALSQQAGPAAVLPGTRALQFGKAAALAAYADLLIDEARLAAG